ncbi:MAG: hypothetical protein JSS97_10405 [Actinobacteria bacterium]|nr:hypothetical protein [Actinomycetota bacterium]
MSSQDACAVCGRTFLVGEQVHPFVSAEGRHEVCELCAGRTAEFGWLPADQEGAEERLRAEVRRKPGFLARLFARPAREPEEHFDGDEAVEVADEEMPPPAPDATPLATHELETERYDVEARWAEDEEPAEPVGEEPQVEARGAADDAEEQDAESDDGEEVESPPPPAAFSPRARLKDLFAPGTAPRGRGAELPAPEAAEAAGPDADQAPAPLPDPAGRGMRPRRLQPDLSPATRFERAVARFNSSEAGRTVSGLTRTLGAPSVSVGDLAGAADEVRVTVAWELTWYQWGVDLGDELRPVFELAKGYEIEEIDAPARQWNASAHEGRVVMVAPGRREAADGKPVPR